MVKVKGRFVADPDIQYLRRWFHNHAVPKVRAKVQAKSHVVSEEGVIAPLKALQFKSKRLPQLSQLYCKKYYSARIAPLIRRHLKGRKPTKKEFLRLLRKFSDTCFKVECPAVKEDIAAEYQRRVDAKDEVQPATPADYAA